MHAIRLKTLCLLVSAYCGLAAVAHAQNPEEGDIGAGFSGDVSASGSVDDASATGTASAEPTSYAQPATTEATTEEVAVDGESDHDSVIGTFGVGFFGIIDLPLYREACAGAGGCQTLGTVSAPTIGARYWLSYLIAIEASVGLALDGGSGDTQTTGNVSTTSKDSAFGFALHGGVPLALMDMGHFVFEVVPQLNVGFTSGTLSSAMGDIDSSGFLFQAGSTIGAEIHFGFIGIPQLSLQANIGLLLSFQSWSQDNPNGNTYSNKRTIVSTLAGEDPWEIFVGNIHAIYYF